MSRILLVEDEVDLASGLVDVLRLKGYEADHVVSAEDARLALSQTRYQLMLLDVSLPGMSGFELLRVLASKPPTILLTSRATEMDKLIGFELGVEDYVTKPFSLLELLARVQVVLRRAPNLEVLQFGPVQLDLQGFKVLGRDVVLPAKAFEMMRLLHRRQGQAVTRDELIDGVWGVDENITQRTLNNLIVKIRQAIETDPEQPRHLLTVHGVGYRLEM